MENFKINNYERNNSFEEFQTLSLEHLNEEFEQSRRDGQEFEQNREQNIQDSRAEIMDIFERQKESGRDNHNLFENKIQESGLESELFEGYGASFVVNYFDREGYIARPNQHRTQKELRNEIESIKNEKRTVGFGQRASNFIRAIGF